MCGTSVQGQSERENELRVDDDDDDDVVVGNRLFSN